MVVAFIFVVGVVFIVIVVIGFGVIFRLAVSDGRIVRCVRQERISIRGSFRRSVRPSVGPSVRYACAKNAFLGCFGHGEILH